jgi:AhpD family alkylhydroperoxidase
MPPLPLVTRDQLPEDLRPLWDECERVAPSFRHLWGTMANSPTIFRHVWGQLLELKRTSPVEARQYEIGIVVVSTLTRCAYCLDHHTPLAEAAGLTSMQLDALAKLELGPLPADHDFPIRPGFSADDSLVVDVAYFLVWAGIHARTADVHPRVVHALRRRLHARLLERFTPRQIEELTWRFTQCVAFNWHNEFFELDNI